MEKSIAVKMYQGTGKVYKPKDSDAFRNVASSNRIFKCGENFVVFDDRPSKLTIVPGTRLKEPALLKESATWSVQNGLITVVVSTTRYFQSRDKTIVINNTQVACDAHGACAASNADTEFEDTVKGILLLFLLVIAIVVRLYFYLISFF